jgi:hypothetical protein
LNFLPVPANVDEVVLIIPCIFNTLPGTVPENWEIPLRFVPATADLTVLPVVELSPSPPAGATEAGVTPAAHNDSTENTAVENAVTVQKVIETADGYILAGRIHFPDGVLVVPAGAFEIRDANGKLVSYTVPLDIGLDRTEIGPEDFPMVQLSQPDLTASAGFEFDAGANPQIGQELASDQEIELLGHTLSLASLKVNGRNGYDFTFRADPEVYGASVQLEGYTPTGWIGGGNSDGTFDRGLSFASLPTGKLKANVSGLTLIDEPVTWQGEWSPGTP